MASDSAGSGVQASLQPTSPIPIVRLVIDEGPVCSPGGEIVYSTGPRSWVDEQNVSYVVKGPDPAVVVAEAVGYLLARLVGLAVPQFALGVRAGLGHLYFASRKLLVARDITHLLRRHQSPTLDAIRRIVAFDVWIGNQDRNMGNLLVAPDDPEETGGVTQPIVAIDFEKAVAIREQHAIMASASVPPTTLWPRAGLGETLRGGHPPRAMIDRISDVSDIEIETAVTSVERVVEAFTSAWASSVVQALRRRRKALPELLAEVWQ